LNIEKDSQTQEDKAKSKKKNDEPAEAVVVPLALTERKVQGRVFEKLASITPE
jgi:hypothetical protein